MSNSTSDQHNGGGTTAGGDAGGGASSSSSSVPPRRDDAPPPPRDEDDSLDQREAVIGGYTNRNDSTRSEEEWEEEGKEDDASEVQVQETEQQHGALETVTGGNAASVVDFASVTENVLGFVDTDFDEDDMTAPPAGVAAAAAATVATANNNMDQFVRPLHASAMVASTYNDNGNNVIDMAQLTRDLFACDKFKQMIRTEILRNAINNVSLPQ